MPQIPQSRLKPMSIGRILDRSFHLYRKHFVKLTLIMLILYGPFYLLQHLVMYNKTASSTSLIDLLRNGSSLDDMVKTGGALGGGSGIETWQIMVFVLILLPILMFALTPVAAASMLFLVKNALLGLEIPSPTKLLKQAFRRFWPLVGNSVLMGLIVMGIFFGLALIAIAFTLIFVFGSGINQMMSGGKFGAGTGVFFIVFIILLYLGLLIGWSYFLIRWGYYLPVIAFQEDSVGIGQSWRVTRRSFWRLFLMYIVLVIVINVFSLVIAALMIALAGNGLFGQLLQSLVSILISPLWLLPYAVSYFDLKVRNDGMGLEDMIQATVYGEGQMIASPAQDHPTLDQFRESQSPQPQAAEPASVKEAAQNESDRKDE